MIRYYIKQVEESVEECLATYGNQYHESIEEALEWYKNHCKDLGPCIIIKVTSIVEEITPCEN